MGKVQRKEIRPCPPPMERWGDFNPGDIVEVFDNNSWKSAKIVEVRDSGKYSVVIHYGSSSMLEVHKSNIRVRQYWNGNGWVLVDKESEKLNEGGLKIPCIGGKVHYQRLQRYGEVRKHDDEHYQISLRGLRKRLDNGAGAGRKFGAVRKVGKHQRLLPEKVDICASSRIIYGDNYMDASLNNRTIEMPESGMNWGNPNEDVHFFLGSLEQSDSDSLSSSVGSCSPWNSRHRSFDQPENNANRCMGPNFDDNEACSCSGREPREPFQPTTEGGTAEIHQLELNAYHSIMRALYASGPLSWEREALLTNLRLMLHITNDEHLLELRHLNNIKSDLA
ncbi:uncharacterized protein LOC109839968 isoform X2 [Asparagus officinalis]|uniref:uncharacterized protein LOC109839968 isoform X2 n=1 Tax=Asparagus officinalis TaxID=4686 RepID=UPI00098E19C2|nr:uncharacterized protein LOC109839968 isoform X2 [Asparagus officinalis]